MKDVLKGNVLCLHSELRNRYGFLPWDGWRYRQFQHFVAALPKSLRSVHELSPWEKLVDQGGMNRHGISDIYKRRILPLDTGSSGLIERWKQESNQPLPEVLTK